MRQNIYFFERRFLLLFNAIFFIFIVAIIIFREYTCRKMLVKTKKKSFYKFNEKCTDILKFKIFTLKNLFKYLTLWKRLQLIGYHIIFEIYHPLAVDCKITYFTPFMLTLSKLFSGYHLLLGKHRIMLPLLPFLGFSSTSFSRHYTLKT